MNERRKFLSYSSIISNKRTQLSITKTIVNTSLIDYSDYSFSTFAYFDSLMDMLWIFFACLFVFVVIFTLIKCFCKRNKLTKKHQTTIIPLIQTNFDDNNEYNQSRNHQVPQCEKCHLVIQSNKNQLLYQLTFQCGHSFHYHCIAIVIKPTNACPLCNANKDQYKENLELTNDINSFDNII